MKVVSHVFFGRFLWLMAVAVLTARGATLTYTEPITIEWGKVEFTENGQQEEEEIWFTRIPPTFACNGQFTKPQRLCLSNSLLVCTGHVGRILVWRMDGTLNGAFKERVEGDHRFDGKNFRPPTKPDDWQTGKRIRSWNFTLKYEVDADNTGNPPPTLELALLAEEVPQGVAWVVPIARAQKDTQVQRYAELCPEGQAAVARSAPWARLFLTAPSSLQKTNHPRVVPVPDLAPFALPISFGVRALAEVTAVFGEDRAFRETTYGLLRGRLSPETTNSFRGAHRWFPEPDISRHELDGVDVLTDSHPGELVRVGYPTAGKFDTQRVLPEVNEWAIRVGPFRRVQPPLVRVDQVRGRTKDHPVESLPTLLAGQPEALAQYQADIRKQETNLVVAANNHAPGNGEFFWLPDLVEKNALAVQAMEAVQFTDNIKPTFQTNRVVYHTTYAPATVTGKLGASYNPEQRFGANVEAGWSGLLRPGDALSAKATIAERAIDGELSFRLPYHRSLDRRSRFQIEILGQAGKDDHFRLGSLSTEPLHHQHQSGGVEHQIWHQGDGWELTERDAVLWDAHDLSQPETSRSFSDAGFLFRHRQIWRFTPTASKNAALLWEHTVTPTLTFGPQLGWDKTFGLGELPAGAKASFCGEDHRAMYISLRGALGESTAGLPPALLYRLGDAERLFGLEPGEFSGRSYVHGEAAYGLSLSHLLGGLFENKKNQTDKDETPAFLDGLYLQVLAEIGTISTDGGLRAVSQPDKVVTSYGVALEKTIPEFGRGAGFRIGYAWSPDSLRSGGRIFTALNWNF